MMQRWLASFVAPAALCAAATAQESPAQEAEVVELRVMTATAGRVVVDRGSADGVAPGDRVELEPRGGKRLAGVVTDVRERIATVELDERTASVAAGTRGTVRVPVARRPRREPPKPAPQEPTKEATPPPETPAETAPTTPVPATSTAPGAATAERPAWSNAERDFPLDQPLLSRVPPMHPAQRAARWSGRAWNVTELERSTDGGWSDSTSRTGADVRADNLFGDGETLRADLELDWRAEQDEGGRSLDLLPKRLSWQHGGSRFDADRLEVGRFLQYAVPEFGFLDGVEWGRRLEGGDRFAASLGWMPQPDDDFRSFDDLQAAASYEWIVDESERLALTTGLQQTWHQGETDRRLALMRARWLPASGFDVSGSLQVDFYDGNDDVKDAAAEVTQALLLVARRFAGGAGLELTAQHQAFPELQREGEFLPLDPAALDDQHVDRLGLSGRTARDAPFSVHGDASVFSDQDGDGGAIEGGFDLPLPLFEDARLDVTSFLTRGSFARVTGFRIGAVGHSGGTGATSWSVFWELANHRQEGFSSQLDDVVQQRFFASQTFADVVGMRCSLRFEFQFQDREKSLSGGVALERSF